MLKFIIILIFSLTAQAQIQETPLLQDCFNLANTAAEKLNHDDVIYVFDIDNTVLKLKHNFGSAQWFRWQQKMIQDNSPERISNSVDELLAIQSSIYQLSSAETPEATTAILINQLQTKGYSVIFHTSRNLDTRESTVRDLKQNGLLPLVKTLGPVQGFAGTITYEQAPSTQRAVSFQSGVYMSAGQDKGIWLNLLFEKIHYVPKHIVFVDDELKNLTNVERAFKDKTPLTLCRYGAADTTVHDFETSDKAVEKAQWSLLRTIKEQLQ